MEQERGCEKCGCIKLAHTGKAGGVTVGFGMVIHVGEGYCLSCIQRENPCFAWVEK